MRKHSMKRFILIQFLIGILAGYYCFTSIPSIHAPYEMPEITDFMELTVERYEEIDAQWEKIGTDPYLDVWNQDTSCMRFNWSTNLEKSHSRWHFENITREDIDIVTSILNVTVYWYFKCEGVGDWFRFEPRWYNGTQYVVGQAWGSGTGDWAFVNSNLSSIINTPLHVQNVMLHLRNWGAPSWDWYGRISNVYLLVWFTYTEAPPYSIVDEYFGLGLFLGGIIMMIFAPSWLAWGVKKRGVDPDTVERAGYAMLIFLVGFGLFLTYIYAQGKVSP